MEHVFLLKVKTSINRSINNIDKVLIILGLQKKLYVILKIKLNFFNFF